jgi:hypothetical protein
MVLMVKFSCRALPVANPGKTTRRYLPTVSI